MTDNTHTNPEDEAHQDVTDDSQKINEDASFVEGDSQGENVSNPYEEGALSNNALVKAPEDDKATNENSKPLGNKTNIIENIETEKEVQLATQPVLPPPNSVIVKKSGRVLSTIAILLSLTALAGSGALFYKGQEVLSKFDDAKKELGQQALSDTKSFDTSLQKANEENQAKQEAIAVRLVQLESRLTESGKKTDQQLNTLYQELTKTQYEWVLNEVEYSLSMAQIQLQLTGDATVTIGILESIQERLSRFAVVGNVSALQAAISQDIMTLKQYPKINITAISSQLELMAESAVTLPTTVDSLAAKRANTVETQNNVTLTENASSWWDRTWNSIGTGLGSLVKVRKLDSDEPVLFRPEQTYFVRENLRLQINNARLSLMFQQKSEFINELNTIEISVRRNFDQDSVEVQKLLKQIEILKSMPDTGALPTLSASLASIGNLQKSMNKSISEDRNFPFVPLVLPDVEAGSDVVVPAPVPNIAVPRPAPNSIPTQPPLPQSQKLPGTQKPIEPQPLVPNNASAGQNI